MIDILLTIWQLYFTSYGGRIKELMDKANQQVDKWDVSLHAAILECYLHEAVTYIIFKFMLLMCLPLC